MPGKEDKVDAVLAIEACLLTNYIAVTTSQGLQLVG